jgi:hypothetical protein
MRDSDRDRCPDFCMVEVLKKVKKLPRKIPIDKTEAEVPFLPRKVPGAFFLDKVRGCK